MIQSILSIILLLICYYKPSNRFNEYISREKHHYFSRVDINIMSKHYKLCNIILLFGIEYALSQAQNPHQANVIKRMFNTAMLEEAEFDNLVVFTHP